MMSYPELPKGIEDRLRAAGAVDVAFETGFYDTRYGIGITLATGQRCGVVFGEVDGIERAVRLLEEWAAKHAGAHPCNPT